MRSTDWVQANALRFPDHVALRDAEGDRSLTWRRLDSAVGLCAAALQSRGLGVGSRVGYLGENDIDTFILAFALMRLRAVFVPLNWRLAAAELETQLGIVQPDLLVHDRSWAELAKSISKGIEVSAYSGDQDSLLAGSDVLQPIAQADGELDDVWQLLFTSGTTGIPKAVEVTVGSLLWHAMNVSQPDDIRGPGDNYLSVLPLFHTGGLNILSMPILLAGGCVSVVKRFDAATSLKLLSDPDLAITHFMGVPIMLAQMVDDPGFQAADLSRLRHIQVGAGLPGAGVVDAFTRKGAPLQTHYGGTEFGPGVAAVPREMVGRKPGAVGLINRHTRAKIVDDGGREVPPGEVGEILLSGPSVAKRYAGVGAGSTLDADGWLHTGDLGRFDADGYLYVVDRKKDMYKSGGENVYPAEVEAVLTRHPQVTEVAVIPIPDEKWGQVGLAIYASESGLDLDTEALREFCRQSLAGYKLPHRFQRLDSLPRNATGKIAKSELQRQFSHQTLEGPAL